MQRSQVQLLSTMVEELTFAGAPLPALAPRGAQLLARDRHLRRAPLQRARLRSARRARLGGRDAQFVRQAVRARSELIRNSALIVTSSSGRIENCEGSAEGCVESGGSAQSIPLYR